MHGGSGNCLTTNHDGDSKAESNECNELTVRSGNFPSRIGKNEARASIDMYVDLYIAGKGRAETPCTRQLVSLHQGTSPSLSYELAYQVAKGWAIHTMLESNL